MLDDLKMIHERDAQDALGIAEKESAQLTYEFNSTGNAQFHDIDTIVYAGMGGSALAALLLHTWPLVRAPFEVVREYDIPAYVGTRTLFIASSYSGNTEETVSSLAEAEAKGAQIAVIAGGGKLQHIAEEKGYALLTIPKVNQPRFAVFYNYRALLQLLQIAGVVTEDFRPALEKTAAFLAEAVKAWRPDVPTAQNYAKQLALEMIGKSVVIYGGPKMWPAAYKWKISFNENAKQIAWWNQYSEFNHNEFIGWSKQPVDKPYAIVELRSPLEHLQIQKRFVVSERLLSGMRPSPIVITPEGDSIVQQLFWSVALGDFVTLYTALLNGLNPTPVDLVEKLKTELER